MKKIVGFTKKSHGNLGKKRTIEQRLYLSLSHPNQKGELNPNWKGDKVGYYGVHRWVETILGKPKYCEFCKSSNANWYDWANISGEYKRELSDWVRLCRKCHMFSDNRIKNLKQFQNE